MPGALFSPLKQTVKRETLGPNRQRKARVEKKNQQAQNEGKLPEELYYAAKARTRQPDAGDWCDGG